MPTIEQALKTRDAQIQSNQDLGVIDYKTSEPLSDSVYEVTEGYKRLPGGKVLGPGQRFRPTARQVASGSLRNKARELTASEYRGLRAERRVFAGADFREMEERAAARAAHNTPEPPQERGWDDLNMGVTTVAYAQEHGLTPADFDGVEPEGTTGRYTRTQVEAMVAARQTEG